MKQASDRNAFAQLVETLNSSLGLQDLDGNTFVGQHFECLWTDLEPLPSPACRARSRNLPWRGPARPVLALLPGRCADCGRLLPLVPNPSGVKAPALPPGASFLFAPWFLVPVTQRGTLQAGKHRSGVAFVAVGVTGLPVLRVKYCYLFTHPQPYRGVINVQ